MFCVCVFFLFCFFLYVLFTNILLSLFYCPQNYVRFSKSPKWLKIILCCFCIFLPFPRQDWHVSNNIESKITRFCLYRSMLLLPGLMYLGSTSNYSNRIDEFWISVRKNQIALILRKMRFYMKNTCWVKTHGTEKFSMFFACRTLFIL